VSTDLPCGAAINRTRLSPKKWTWECARGSASGSRRGRIVLARRVEGTRSTVEHNGHKITGATSLHPPRRATPRRTRHCVPRGQPGRSRVLVPRRPRPLLHLRRHRAGLHDRLRRNADVDRRRRQPDLGAHRVRRRRPNRPSGRLTRCRTLEGSLSAELPIARASTAESSSAICSPCES
jgi:hypothetical protein